MMRIKEAIQRKRLIHEMNEEWKEDFYTGIVGISPMECLFEKVSDESLDTGLQNFVSVLSGKLSEHQKRALKVTWKRLSEAPKTSGRGTIQIMEKVLDKLCEKEPAVTTIFYKSAFLSCIDDRRCGRRFRQSISTLRDHAHILVELIDSIIQCLFDGTSAEDSYDPTSIGRKHARLQPLGFERKIWLVLGECLAEVMFMQECIRAYPHAASAWSFLAVALTDTIYAAAKPQISRQKLQRERSLDSVQPSTAAPDESMAPCPYVRRINSDSHTSYHTRLQYRHGTEMNLHSNSYQRGFQRLDLPHQLERSQSESRFSSLSNRMTNL